MDENHGCTTTATVVLTTSGGVPRLAAAWRSHPSTFVTECSV
ncbi:hypothetical protein [Rhodococcus sp. (in: high G+C Gram-positive bacteria)]|nr:hypothetical protein [Rhodococcus sp. (in: high G+C Gram-positive bacteria)]